MLNKTDGKIWVGTIKGLSVFDPKKNNFKNYKHDPDDPNSLSDSWLNKIYKDRQGEIWIGFKDGSLFKYLPKSDRFEKYNCRPIGEFTGDFCIHSIYDIKQDLLRDSILWIATQKGLMQINKYSGAAYQHYFEVPEVKLQSAVNYMRCIYPHEDGKIYYGTWDGGMNVFDIKTGSFAQIDRCEENKNPKFEKNVILGFYPNSKNDFWVNSTGGLQIFDIDKQCLIKSIKNEKDKFYCINHIDKSGRIWSATRGNGFKIYNPIAQQYDYLFFEGNDFVADANARKILEDTILNRIYVAADMARGLYYFDKNQKKWHCIPPPGEYDLIAGIGFECQDLLFLENNQILVLEEKRLFLYQPGWKQLRLYPVQPPDRGGFLHFLKASDGMIWLTGGHTIWQLDIKKQKIYSLEERIAHIENGKPEPNHLTEDIYGNIWIRITNGLMIYNKAMDEFIYHPHNSKGQGAFRGMGAIESAPDGSIWIATLREYLAYGHANNIEAGVQHLYGKEQGLLGNKVLAAKPWKNKIIVITDKGIQFFNPVSLKFETSYAQEYGLSELRSSRVTALSNDQLAISSSKKIILFDPGTLKINEEKPIPYISTFKVFNDNWNLKTRPSKQDSIFLSYKQNFFSFEFSAIAYNLPKKTNYKYKLEGFDAEWQDGTQRKFAAYTNVPGGDYQFKLIATNNEGHSLNTPTITHLHISTVWYKTIWFWCFLAILLSVLAYFVYKWRIRQVRKEERLKSDYERKLAAVEMSALRAQMNPHFIFNSLNSIEYYIINNDPEKASDYLNRFSRLIRLILHNSKNTVVPLKDDLEALKLYIEMESMRFDDLFDYEVQVDSAINMERIEVPPMLLQPYVENAIWHGLMQKTGARGKLDLKLKRSNGNMICYIEDNGIGRAASAKLKSKSATRRKSYGMKITSDRLAMLNNLAGADASVRIIDLANDTGEATGTRVELIIPI